MGNFRTPGNARKLPPSKVNSFSGIDGEANLVIKRTNAKGWDISNLFMNDIRDFDLTISGTAILREGSRKVDNTGKSATITSIFATNLGGKRGYGIIYGGHLDVTIVPDYVGLDGDPIILVPATARSTVATENPIADPSRY